MGSRTIKVWDPFVRLFHWALAVSYAVAWLTAELWDSVHEGAGYVAGALIAMRIVWGLVGPRYARFGQFVRSRSSVLRYLGQMLRGSEARYVGHNPAGGAMVVALLVAVATTALSGWLCTLDYFWGAEWVEGLHELLANLSLVLVGLHVAGVAIASIRHGENLVRSMIDGRKRVPEPGDVA